VRCISLNASYPQIYLSLAQACARLTRYEKAEQALLAAYQLNQAFIPSLISLAVHYCESGRYEISERYLNEVLNVDPDNIQAFSLAIRMKKISRSNTAPYIARMLEKLNGNDKLSTIEASNLLYSFGELHHQESEYAQAFEYFDKANKLQRADINFSAADMKGYFSSLHHVFSPDLLTSLEQINESTEGKKQLTPIFIIGQPRSGSTLLEQILIGHSDISSGGELPFLAGAIAKGLYQLTGKHFPEAVRSLNDSQKKVLGDHYLKNLQNLSPESDYIIDKMPANYQSIGLIKMLMPQAKIIHITRDPIDVSWSIFRNNFASPEPYFCSLPEIIDYQHCYEKVMAHWNEYIPDFIHTISYEALVKAPDTEIKKVLSFCSLSFQPECLAFAQQKRMITTLSDIQLREGINADRVKNWLPYAKFLKPLLTAFDV
jgi:tetratricopeptide (TPR) repeat protein